MEIIKICVVFIIAAFISLLLRGADHNIGLLIGAVGLIIAVTVVLDRVSPIYEYIKDLSYIDSTIIAIIIKSLGIAYITEFAASICRDTGDSSLATGVEIIGKTEIIIIGFPLFKQVIDMCTKMVE